MTYYRMLKNFRRQNVGALTIATEMQQMKHGSATMTMMYSDFVKSVALFGLNAGTKSFFVSGEKNPAMKVANVSNICIPK